MTRAIVLPDADLDRMESKVLFFGQSMDVSCDGKCHKAWGINARPKISLSDDEDDFVWLADSEVGEAPKDPGSYEGGVGKPRSPIQFPNKWCVRECERCAHPRPGRPDSRDFSKRVFNIPSLHS